MVFSAWTAQARLRRNLRRALRPLGPSTALMEPIVPGRSFVDVGGMWGIDGRVSFLAEEHGASAVTLIDVLQATPAYEAEHTRRGSKVRFVHGDLHDPETLEAVGRHDVVWCAGVIYHVPDPRRTLECLHHLTGETLLLTAMTIPELPGVENGAVFYPQMRDGARERFNRLFETVCGGGTRVGLTDRFEPEGRYDNWWWGLTPSALRSLVSVSGFAVSQVITNGFDTRIVARTR
jgi:hypothetical protein